MTRRVGSIAVLLLAASLAGCGSSQPSSSAPSTVPSAAVPSTPEPSASAEPASPAAVLKPPPKPGNTTFKHVDTKPGPKKYTFTETYKITWTEPKGAADRFLVYGMEGCPRFSKKHQGEPCILPGTKVDADELKLLDKVPGDKRSTTISWNVGEVDIPPYGAILMRASNDAGESIFSIVKSYDVCYACTY